MNVERTHKITTLLSVRELAQLQRLADDEGVPTTQLVRALVKRAYVRRFGEETACPTAATVRGLLEDLTGRAHYTAGNIAERMGVPRDAVAAALARLAKRGVVMRQTGFPNGDSSWEGKPHNREGVLATASAKGVDLDERLVNDGEE